MVISLRLKKVHVNGIRVIGVVGFVVLFLVFLTVPNIGNANFFKSVDITPQTAEDIVNEAKIIGQYSVVETDELFTESNDSILQQFLDSSNIDSPLSTEKFGIVTDVVLFDINNNKITYSDILGVPQLVITDDQSNVLSLSTVQVSFSGITKSPETSVDISGLVKFYLDDDLIATKKIWISDRSKQTLIPLYVVDNIPPSFSERKTNFTFTLSDEGKTWKTGTVHYYRIVISELTASLNSEKEQKEFNWSGEHVAYELKVYADETRIAMITDSKNVISILKSDGTLKLCGELRKSDRYNVQFHPANVHVEIDGVSVNTNPVVSMIVSEREYYGEICGLLLSNIQRNSTFTVYIDDASFTVHTPLSQKNYIISQKVLQDGWNGNEEHSHTYSNIDGFPQPYYPTHRPKS